MRVTISVGGRFHAFNLAEQLSRRNYLERLITSYPKFEVIKYGIPQNKVRSILLKEIIERSWRKLPLFLRRAYNPQYAVHELYDLLALREIGEADIFVGWSSFALHSLRKAKQRGMVTVLDRGSSHIAYQNKILKEEYDQFGVQPEAFQLPHPKIIEKEIKEYEEADYIAISSSFVRRSFLEYGVPEGKLIQVPYGVDLSQFRQMPKEDSVFRVVFVGGMTLRKGVHYLLQAFAELNLPHAELLLVGTLNEEMKPFFKKYEGIFKWIGHVPQKELYRYYSQGSVFVIMSIEEGGAMVQAQAMACGLPVIFTPNTGGEDFIRDGVDGYMVPIRNVEKLKEKMLYLYEHQDFARRMGEKAKERVRSGFTWDDYGKKMIAAYEKILRETH